MMKTFKVVVLAVLLSGCVPTEKITKGKSELSAEIKIVNINLEHKLNSKQKARKLAEEIVQSGSEIVFLQQVLEPKPGSDDFNAIKFLAKELDWNYYFGMARFYEGQNSGNAILSLFPIQQRIIHSLPTVKGKVRKAITFGVIDIGLRAISCGSTEFDNENKIERVQQAKSLNNYFKKIDNNLILIGGSFYLKKEEKGSDILNENFKTNDLNLRDEISIFVSKSEKISVDSFENFETPVGFGKISKIKIKQ